VGQWKDLERTVVVLLRHYEGSHSEIVRKIKRNLRISGNPAEVRKLHVRTQACGVTAAPK
jgi:hypothetical protein